MPGIRFVSVLQLLALAAPLAWPGVFPEPREMEPRQGHFQIDEGAVLLLPRNAAPADRSLARLVAADLADLHGLAVRTIETDRITPGTRAIVLGTPANPLVKAACTRIGVEVSAASPGREGYLLDSSPELVLVAGSDDAGAFYGVQSLRQLIERDGRNARVPALRIRDWPYKPLRGIKLYLPGRDNIGYFKRFIRDFMAYYKYNTLILETNAAMRLDRHPELNAGWYDFGSALASSRLSVVPGPRGIFPPSLDSPHYDTADGGVLEKSEVADLVRWAREHHIDVIPELPTLSHAYYLLSRHRELAETPDAEWPAAYCPHHPETHRLVFDVLDEYIEVTQPKIVHVGHDEWRVVWGDCPRCKDKNPAEVYAHDIRQLHGYLASKNIRMMIWCDHLLESARGPSFAPPKWNAPAGTRIAGALSPEQVKRWIPKDILLMNWTWDYPTDQAGEENERLLSELGFEQIYGNLRSRVPNYAARSLGRGVIGGAPSAWLSTTEFNFGKDVIGGFIGCSSLLWSSRWLENAELARMIQDRMPDARRRLSGRARPSEGIDPVVPLRLDRSFNARIAAASPGFPPEAWRGGRVQLGRQVFELAGGEGNQVAAVAYEAEQPAKLPREAPPIPIGEDVSSIIFLHAAARRGVDDQGYRQIFNHADTAGLLGWYEVVYEDGLVETVPIRYGVNIFEWSRRYSEIYFADAVRCGGTAERPVTFFSFEWTNPRPGKAIQEVRLKGARRFRDYTGKVMRENAVLLAAVSVVKKRAFPGPVRATRQGQKP